MRIAAPSNATYLCFFAAPYEWTKTEEQNAARRECVRGMFADGARAPWALYPNGSGVWVYTTETDESAVIRAAAECTQAANAKLAVEFGPGSESVSYVLINAAHLREDFVFAADE